LWTAKIVKNYREGAKDARLDRHPIDYYPWLGEVWSWAFDFVMLMLSSANGFVFIPPEVVAG